MAISADEPAESRTLAKELGLTFALLSDEGLTITGGFGVRQEGQDIAVPATFVLDKGGVVRWEKIGDSPPHGHGPTVSEIVAAVGALPR